MKKKFLKMSQGKERMTGKESRRKNEINKNKNIKSNQIVLFKINQGLGIQCSFFSNK